MSYVKNVLQEEHDRLQELCRKYSGIIESLPKGTISIKKRNRCEYLYLANRRGGKVKFSYIGPVASEDARNIMEQVSLRKSYEQKLKQVKDDIKEIEKAINGRKI